MTRIHCDVCERNVSSRCHSFPEKDERCEEWAKSLEWSHGYRQQKRRNKDNRSIHICTFHFEQDQYYGNDRKRKLIYTAVPTVRHPEISDSDGNEDYIDDEMSELSTPPVLAPEAPAIDIAYLQRWDSNETYKLSQHTISCPEETLHERNNRISKEKRDLSNMSKYSIVDNSLLVELLSHLPGCVKCKDTSAVRRFSQQGVSLIIKIDCPSCEKYSFSSTKMLVDDTQGTVLEGNMDLITSAYTSGIGYERLIDLCETMSLNCPTRRTQSRVLRQYINKTVDDVYAKHQVVVKNRIEEDNKKADETVPLSLVGDAQFDSRGYSAAICRYTMMDYKTKLIYDFEILSRVDTNGNSPLMELKCFERIMERLKTSDFEIGSITTDKNSSIVKSMRTNYPSIAHKLDKWHLIKNIKKSYEKEVFLRRNADLQYWWIPILGHIWTSISAAGGVGDLAVELIQSSYFHVQGIHKFPPNAFTLLTECMHTALPNQSPYLNISNERMKRQLEFLHKILYDKYFVANIRVCAPYQTTSPIESFHAVVARIYLDKNTYYNPKASCTQMKMGIMHHNQTAMDHLDQLSQGICPKTKKKFSRAQKRDVLITYWPKTIPSFKKDLVKEVKQLYKTSKEEKMLTRKLGRPKKLDIGYMAEDTESSDDEEFIYYDDEMDEFEEVMSNAEMSSSEDEMDLPATPPVGAYVPPPDAKPVVRLMRRNMRKLLIELGPTADNFDFFDKLSGEQIIPDLLDI